MNLFHHYWSIREPSEHDVNMCLRMHYFTCRKLRTADPRSTGLCKMHTLQRCYDLTHPHLELEFPRNFWSPCFLHFTIAPASPFWNHLHRPTPGLFLGKVSCYCMCMYIFTISAYNSATILTRCLSLWMLAIMDFFSAYSLTLPLGCVVFIAHFAQCCHS